MNIPDKLKLNKFKLVSIPRPSQIIGRLGFHEMTADSYKGEDAPPESMSQSKLDIIAEQNEILWQQYQALLAKENDA